MTIFRGGKSRREREKILAQAPPEFQDYREPFVGVGSIFFDIDPKISRRWINDINPHLMEVYYALHERPYTFIAKCRAKELSDKAVKYFFENRTNSYPNGWNIVDSNKLEQAAAIVQGVFITCQDYRTVLLSPGKDVWIYCDPPSNFTKEAHTLFAHLAKSCVHKLCISYDDDKEGYLRDLYPGFHICESGTSSDSDVLTKTKKKGLLITNYEV